MSAAEFLDLLEGVKRSKEGWMARCPAHEDRHASLSVGEGDDGRVIVHCFAGCTADKITAALGLRLADLFAGPPIDWSRFTPRTPEERQAAELRRLRRHIRNLELDRRRAWLALQRAGLLIALAYSDEPEGVVDHLWSGACAELDRQAAVEADAYCKREDDE